MPSSAGTKPKMQPALGGPLLIEHLSEEEGWAILTGAGRQLNPYIRTAPALAFYISRENLASRIENLDVLPPKLQTIALNRPR